MKRGPALSSSTPSSPPPAECVWVSRCRAPHHHGPPRHRAGSPRAREAGVGTSCSPGHKCRRYEPRPCTGRLLQISMNAFWGTSPHRKFWSQGSASFLNRAVEGVLVRPPLRILAAPQREGPLLSLLPPPFFFVPMKCSSVFPGSHSLGGPLGGWEWELGEETVQNFPIWSQKGPGRQMPPVLPSSRRMVCDLGTCECSWEEGEGVEISCPLMSPSEIAAPSPELFFTFFKGILVFKNLYSKFFCPIKMRK